ncbi:MAG: mannosyltransferase family protein, partial [Ardenticatenaceae bacterium]
LWLRESVFPVAVFGLSRAGLLLVVYLGLVFVPLNADFRDPWHAFPDNLLLDGWVRWDAGWYHRIATEGYTNLSVNAEEQKDTVFFPLYPLLIQQVARLVGNPFAAGLLVSNGAFLLALILFFRLARSHYDSATAQRAVLLLALSPFSFYFSTMYSESLFLFAATWAFYFGERRRWAVAALGAAAASATRLVGVLVPLGLLVLYLEQRDFQWRKIRPDVLWTLAGASGLLAYMLFLWRAFGDPYLFIKNQYVRGWALDAGPEVISGILRNLSLYGLLSGRYDAINFLHLLILPVVLLGALLAWRRPRIAYSLWSIATIIGSLGGWRSMGRYTSVLFPLYIVAALYLGDGWAYRIALYFSTLLLALFAIMYSHVYWVS